MPCLTAYIPSRGLESISKEAARPIFMTTTGAFRVLEKTGAWVLKQDHRNDTWLHRKPQAVTWPESYALEFLNHKWGYKWEDYWTHNLWLTWQPK